MYLGIDVGGTNLVAGVVTAQGKILAKESCPTDSRRPIEAIVDDCIVIARKAAQSAGLAQKDILSIGFGIPGAVDRQTGEVIYCVNVPFDRTPLAQMVKAQWDVPVFLENDANAAAYGEVRAGSAKGCLSALMVTLGTGVGGGVVIDGKLYTGFNGMGAEFGHVVIVHGGRPCTCGRKGCWEAYASARGLIALTCDAMDKQKDSLMWQLAPTPDEVNGRTAFAAARQGDAAGQAVVDQYIEYLTCGLINIINIFQPEVLCIGGGVCNEGAFLLDPVRAIVDREDFNRTEKKTELRIASLGNDAGLIGAALLGQL